MRWRTPWHHDHRGADIHVCRVEIRLDVFRTRLIFSRLDVYMLRFILLLASGSLAVAQQYTIATVAGGAPPATPVAGSMISIGQPRRVALDKAGNLYFSSSNSVFKLSGSGVLTLVAGNSRAGFSGDNGPAVNAQLNTPQGSGRRLGRRHFISPIPPTTASGSSLRTASSTPSRAPALPVSAADLGSTTTATPRPAACCASPWG